jgi:hypothetical protein
MKSYLLLDRLQECGKRLAEPISRMRRLVGAGKPDEFNSASQETLSLRVECKVVRDAIERHAADRIR